MGTGATRILVFSVVASLLSPSMAHAAYDQTVHWTDMRPLDLGTIFNSQYASKGNLLEPVISPSSHELALTDADSRVNPEFHVPETMREAVSFWLKIYTEYTTQHVILFDERHPSVIFEVLDFRDLAKTARNAAAYEITMERKIESTMRAYRDAFKRLSKRPNPKHPTPIEARILSVVKSGKHKHSFKQLAENLRTQTGQRDNVIKGLLAAEAYFPIMEKIFRHVGVPAELTRLSIVESSFNLNAISKAGASGVWQFMHKSGLEYMLIDEKAEIDERLSPLKSTIAAAKLLKRNRRILGSWPLAVTSYNHGLRTLLRYPAAKRKASKKITKIFDPCSKASKLGWASRNYYAEYLAVLHAESYRHLFYGEPPSPKLHQVSFHRISVPESALSIALKKGVPLQEFRMLNPDIRKVNKKLPKGLWIVLPGEIDNLTAVVKKQMPSS